MTVEMLRITAIEHAPHKNTFFVAPLNSTVATVSKPHDSTGINGDK